VPEFEPYLKAGAHWTCKLIVPEDIRELGTNTSPIKSPKSPNSPAVSDSGQSVTWIIEVASQVIFSHSAMVGFEILVGRDERSLDLGLVSAAVHGHGSPGQIQDHQKSKATNGHNSEHAVKGVYSRAVKLVVEDTAQLWNKPKLPEKLKKSADNESGGDVKYVKHKVHLVILTHGLHSNLNADMLYLKESIDATAAQARKDAKISKSKLQKSSENHSDADGKKGGNDGGDKPGIAPTTGGQEDLHHGDTVEEDEDDDSEQVIVRGFSGNAIRTERGIQYLGKRLAKYVLDLTYPSQPYLPVRRSMSKTLTEKFSKASDKKSAASGPPSHRGSTVHRDMADLESDQKPYQITSISFIGHSLGGLIQLYAIAYIKKHAPTFFTLIKPINFVCMASPLLGLSNENPLYIKFALDFGLVGRTGQDLGLTWRAPFIAKSGWSAMGGMFGSSSKNQHHKNNDPGAKPLLRVLPTGPAHQVLHLFRNRTLYSNVVNDGIVPLRTSCLLFLDWKGLGKVQKARREVGLIGTVAEWGWAEITGANADRGNNGLTDKTGHQIDNASSKEEDTHRVPNTSEAVAEDHHSPRIASGNSPIIRRASKDITKDEDGTPMSNTTNSSFLSDIMHMLRPSSYYNHEKKSFKAQPSAKTMKALQRGQTLPNEEVDKFKTPRSSVENSNMPENINNMNSPPPKTSMLESASDLLHAPLPPTDWIINPSNRPRTIFHDRVYHPSDIPPPPTTKPSRSTRNVSTDSDINGRAPSLHSKDSISSLNSEQGGIKVEEKIARAYHRDLSWRKVLVRLEPDAHNNMIVRRMFANAYGWPVIKHLCDTHFADTHAARTGDDEEPNIDRAADDDSSTKRSDSNPDAHRIKTEDGEEVIDQTATDSPAEETAILRAVEAAERNDELGSLKQSTAEISMLDRRHHHDHHHDPAFDSTNEHDFFTGTSSSSDDDIQYAPVHPAAADHELSPRKKSRRKNRPTPSVLSATLRSSKIFLRSNASKDLQDEQDDGDVDLSNSDDNVNESEDSNALVKDGDRRVSLWDRLRGFTGLSPAV